jgi:heptaprenyl diphosphate synthase/octaprenyl-diphosphate synthase
MSTLDLKNLLGIPGFKKYLQQINTALKVSLEDADPIIRDAALRHALAPSKRLRPALLIAVVQAMGKPINKKVITACAAIELAHISSLIHDDIIDNADSRHGIPTVNSQEGVDQAIIVGDYVLAKACTVAAQLSAEAAQIVATAIARICDGQSREVADQYNLDRDGESMLRSIRGKTAELFAAACRIGGLCAGLPANQRDALATYGEQFGMAFQLIDDVLDFTSTDELLGKSVGNDVVEGVYTMPVLLALHGPRQEEVREALSEHKRPTPAFTTLLIEEYAIGQTLEVTKRCNTLAVTALEPLRKQKGRDLSSLHRLPSAYLDWSLQTLVAPEYRPKEA